MPTAMKPRSYAKHEVELTELSGLSNEDDNEDSPANYVLSASKQERFSNYAGHRTYTSSDTPPARVTLKAREIPTSLDIDQALCFSPRSGLEPLQSKQVARCEPRIRPQGDQNLEATSAIKDFHVLPDSARPLNEGDEGFSTSDPNRRNRTPSASEDEKLSSIQDETQKPSTCQPGLPTTSDEMKGRLKQECCIGIGSWSKDDIPPIDRAQSNTMEEEIDPVPPEIYAMFDKNWLGDVTQCPNGQRRQQPSRPPDAQARGIAGRSSSTFAAHTSGTFQGKSQTMMRVMMTSQREGAVKPALEMVTVKQMDRDLLVPSTKMTLISSKPISSTGQLSVAAQVLALKILLVSSRSLSRSILDSGGSDRYLGHICIGYTGHP
jgi:hypothetical protein